MISRILPERHVDIIEQRRTTGAISRLQNVTHLNAVGAIAIDVGVVGCCVDVSVIVQIGYVSIGTVCFVGICVVVAIDAVAVVHLCLGMLLRVIATVADGALVWLVLDTFTTVTVLPRNSSFEVKMNAVRLVWFAGRRLTRFLL